MKKTTLGMYVALILCSSIAHAAWNVSYEGDVMPNDPSLGAASWGTSSDGSLASVSDGALHLYDTSLTKYATYSREGCAIPGGTPMTMEARVKVLSATASYASYSGAMMGLSTYNGSSGSTYLNLWADHISTRYGDENIVQNYAIDMTEFHTIRIAMTSNNMFYVWVDGNQAFYGNALAEWQNGVFWGGTEFHDATSDTYWDYVRYSKEFLPVPEPSSLIVLGTGLLPIALTIKQRRRQTRQ